MATQQDKSSMGFVAIGLGALALGLGAYFLLKPKTAAASGGDPDFVKAAHTTGTPAAPAGQMNLFGGIWNGSKWAQSPMFLAAWPIGADPKADIQDQMQKALATIDLKAALPAGSTYYEWGIDSADKVVGASMVKG